MRLEDRPAERRFLLDVEGEELGSLSLALDIVPPKAPSESLSEPILLADVVPFLRCPHCGEGFVIASGSLRCSGGHTFDIARQGYVSLIAGGGGVHHGDRAEMVSSRADFLGPGHLSGLRDAIAETAVTVAFETHPHTIVDAGAGTGYYLAAVLDRLPSFVGLALDASRYALRRAAHAHRRAGAIGCDVWSRLPLADGCAALILDVFAPRNGDEFDRILAPGGRLIVVTPTSDHLRELVTPLGLIRVDNKKAQRLESELSPRFTPTGSAGYEQTLRLDKAELRTLVGMGPSAHHLDATELSLRIDRLLEGLPHTPPAEPAEKAASPSPSKQISDARVSVTASVLISVYRKS